MRFPYEITNILKSKGMIIMCLNYYMEECSGDFSDFDYCLNADLEGDVTVISAFLNHDRVNFNYLLIDFKCMLYSLKERFRYEQGVDKSKAAPEYKEYEVKMDPNEHEVIVTLYHADFDTKSLIESFAYAVGYTQSFMIHGFSESVSE